MTVSDDNSTDLRSVVEGPEFQGTLNRLEELPDGFCLNVSCAFCKEPKLRLMVAARHVRKNATQSAATLKTFDSPRL